jgi:serine/threonine protein phosphatase 1
MTSTRTFVVGDIHGCVDELDWLLEAIAPTSSDTMIFLGDYVDRGPASGAVIERLLRLRRGLLDCVFLRGNHEDMFLAYMGQHGLHGDAFLYNGGEATLRSYGVERRTPQDVARALPPEHLEFLLSLKLQHLQGGFLCVHAGLDPARLLTEQREEDLLWIREGFIRSPHPYPYTVLFGHTPMRDVLLDLPYKIGLDTGLVYGNKLSCLELGEKRLFQIRRGQRDVTDRSLRAPFPSDNK